MSTYLSRDGGLNWAEIRKGPFIYEIGDHGALIVMAKHGVPTNEVLYSYNEGKTWNELQISDSNIMISNIIIEPLSISQQFVVYGTETDTDTWSEESDNKNLMGVVVTIDFASLHEPQ
jgi:Sortilin, neurotensin receptor 3,